MRSNELGPVFRMQRDRVGGMLVWFQLRMWVQAVLGAELGLAGVYVMWKEGIYATRTIRG
jgi:hypothetical protein